MSNLEEKSILDGPPSKQRASTKKAGSRDKAPVKSAESTSSKNKVELRFPLKIQVRPSLSISSVVPGSVWRQRPFHYDPKIFMPESDNLHKKIIEVSKQVDGLKLFLSNPTLRMIYGVTGNPDDSKAKYFATYLVSKHIQALEGKARVLWVNLYGGFKNTELDEALLANNGSGPTLLVISNLTKNSTAVKLEKARDLLEAYSNIPRIVVAAGEDPISFLSTRLFVPVNGLAYFSEALIKQEVEVI